jgi:hypothetical protein
MPEMEKTHVNSISAFGSKLLNRLSGLPFLSGLSNEEIKEFDFLICPFDSNDAVQTKTKLKGRIFEWIGDKELAGQVRDYLVIFNAETQQTARIPWNSNDIIIEFFSVENEILFIAGNGRVFIIERSTLQIKKTGFSSVCRIIGARNNCYVYEKMNGDTPCIYEWDGKKERLITKSGIQSSAVYIKDRDVCCFIDENELKIRIEPILR